MHYSQIPWNYTSASNNYFWKLLDQVWSEGAIIPSAPRCFGARSNQVSDINYSTHYLAMRSLTIARILSRIYRSWTETGWSAPGGGGGLHLSKDLCCTQEPLRHRPQIALGRGKMGCMEKGQGNRLVGRDLLLRLLSRVYRRGVAHAHTQVHWDDGVNAFARVIVLSPLLIDHDSHKFWSLSEWILR